MPSLNTKLATAPNTTANYVLKATTSTTIGNSLIFDNGTNVGIGNTNTTYTFDVTGTGRFTGNVNIDGERLTIGGTSNNAIINNIASVRVNIDCDNTDTGESFTIGHNQVGIDNNNVLFRVQDNANTGINTSSPVTTNLVGALTIVKSYNGDTPTSTTAQAYYGNQSSLYLFGRNSGISIISNNNEEGKIIFGNASTAGYASIVTGSGSSSTGGDMYFRVGSDTERFRITSGGEVRISSRNFAVTNNVSNEIGVWVKGIGTHSSGYASIQSFASDVTYDTNLVLQENGGRVGIGITNPSIKLHVVAGSGTGTTTAFCLERGGGYGATFFKQYYNNGSDWGLIVQSSTNADGVKLVQGATSWTSNSDERLKDIIEPISNATNKINTLRAVVGKYKTDDEDKRRLFLIAQDVNNVFPEVVDIDGTDDAYMGIRYSELVPVLVKAIQELKAELDSLKQLVK